MNIWAVSCLFAFTPSHFRSRNYKVFREQLKKHDIKLLTLEFNPEGKFELTKDDADVLIQISEGDIMWQKERLLNIGIDNLPLDTDIVLILDTDIIFAEEDMVDRIKKAMEKYKIVQCFSHTMQLHPMFCIDTTKINFFNIDNSKKYFFHEVDGPSYMKTFINSIGYNGTSVISMGLAWAFRYDIIKKIKYYDLNIIGAGDDATFSALLRIFKNYNLAGSGMAWFPYADMVRNYVEVEDISYIEDTIVYSLYHGEVENKGYVNRHLFFENYDFDSSRDLIIEDGKLFKFKDYVDPKLKENIRQYFISRKENDSLPF